MSRVAIVVAFDLHGVKNSKKFATYSNIKADLAKLKLNKHVVSQKSGKTTQLPANTFVGILSGAPILEKNAGRIRDAARRKVRKIIKKHHPHATIFVFVGKKWAWGKSSI